MLKILTGAEAIARYDAVCHRFPALAINDGQLQATSPQVAGDLGEISQLYDVFVFDAFGVLNVGEVPIAGARERIGQLDEAGKRVFVLTNAASYSFPQVVDKFEKLGFSFAPDQLISSRVVCEEILSARMQGEKWGVVAPKAFDPEELELDCFVLEEENRAYEEADAFLLLSNECWSEAKQALLLRSLQASPRPVICANPDLVAPRETGLTAEPGYFAHALLDMLPELEIEFHGKPFPSVYDKIESLVPDVAPDRIVMMGDSLHTDIWGARVRGWGSVLVTGHGLLKGQDPVAAIHASGLYPDWIVPAI